MDKEMQGSADIICKAIRESADKITKAQLVMASAKLVASGKSETEAIAIVKRPSESR